MHPSTVTVAYVVSGPDAATDALGYQLFVTDEPGDAHRVVEQAARGPRWSPDGDRLAFLLRAGLRWTAACRLPSGDIEDLGILPDDVVELDWAPDGQQLLAVTSGSPPTGIGDQPYRTFSALDWVAEPRRRPWILSLTGEVVAVLGDAERDNVWTPRWAPDGRRFAFISDRGVERERSLAAGLWLHDLRTGCTEELVPPVTPIRTLAWSPDGTSIAYLAAARDNASSALFELWVLDVATRSRRRLAPALDRSVGLPVRGDDERAVGPPNLQWLPDSGSVLALYSEGGRSRLARFDLEGGWRDIIADERCVLEFSLGGSGVAFSWSDPLTPGEVSLLDMESGVSRPATAVREGFISEFDLAPTWGVSAVASDGAEVEGWLTLAADTPPGAPLVLQVHGGPHYPVGERFSFDAQRLAARGMAVLRGNPRGSQGYGQAFADGNLGDWGGRDFDDLLALVDEALLRTDLDRDRVAVMGESYGGYIAAWAVGTSDRFAAAVVENSIADFISAAGGVVGQRFWHSELGGAPWDNPQVYLDRSAITRIARVQASVLVIHCEADATCPVAHGEAIYTALRSLGRDVEFLRVPGEGHFFNVFGSLSRRLHRTRVLDDFLVRHLQPVTAAPVQDPSREETIP